jgi:hypothetical protein
MMNQLWLPLLLALRRLGHSNLPMLDLGKK